MNKYWKYFMEKFKEYMEKSRFFSRNTTPKIVSIIFALVMWLYVMGEVNPEVIEEWKNVNVQLLNVEEMRQEGLVIIGDSDFTVNVKVKGQRTELYKVSASDMVVRADIRGFRKGINSVPIEYSSPSNINVEDINPKEIKVTLDEIVTRQKPVTVHTVGESTAGYEPAQASVTPSEVIIEGPESIVNTVSSVVVDVNITDMTEDIVSKLPLRVVDSEGKKVNGVQIRENLVDVTLPMHRVKEVPIVVELEGDIDENYKITNITATPSFALIKGPKDTIVEISDLRTEAINIGNITKTTTKDINLLLPQGVTTPYLDQDPSVILTVEEIEKKEFEFSKEELDLNDLDEKYIIDIGQIPEKIKLEVVDVQSIIKDLTKDDINLYLSLKGLTEGKYSANILYNSPIKPDKVTINPSKVDFEIKLDDGESPPDNEDDTQQ